MRSARAAVDTRVFEARVLKTLVISVQVGDAGDVATHMASDFRSRFKADTRAFETHALKTPVFRGILSLVDSVQVRFTQARKKEHKPKFLSPDIFGGVGVFHVKGWGPKSSVCPSKPGKSNFFGGISGILPGYPGGA